MNETLFAECVDDYCRGVGANSGVAEHLKANYRTLVIAWKITARDFGEVAFRFVSGKRIPNWPKEHSEAIGRELDAIRREKMLAANARRGPNECPVCDGKGIVIVPHPCCIFRGKVCGYYNPATKEKRATVYTVSVLCTAAKCYAGERAASTNREYAAERNRPRMLTMDAYLHRVGLHVEPTVALREWEREQAAKSRRAAPPDPREENVFRSVVANIVSRQEAWAERGHEYRDPAEVDETEAIPA